MEDDSMVDTTLWVKKLHPDATVPTRGSEGAVGYDLHAYTPKEDIILLPGQRKLVPSGVAMTPPTNYFIRVLARSGLSLRNGLHVMSGVIDPDYTGDVSVMLYNSDIHAFAVEHGMRIGQAVMIRYCIPAVVECDELVASLRGDKGFGSTGS